MTLVALVVTVGALALFTWRYIAHPIIRDCTSKRAVIEESGDLITIPHVHLLTYFPSQTHYVIQVMTNQSRL